MKKKLLPLMTLLVVVLFAAAWAVAQEKAAETKAEEKTEKAPAVKAETISGTISMVKAEQKLVVVTSNNIPYTFQVTGGTRIIIGGKRSKLADLEGQSGKSASVTFLPLHSGNRAQKIEVM